MFDPLAHGLPGKAWTLTLADCTRMNLSGASILDCDGVGLQLTNTTLTRVSGCIVRDDRGENKAPAIQVSGGYGNHVVGNMLDRRAEIPGNVAVNRDNEIVPKR